MTCRCFRVDIYGHQPTCQKYPGDAATFGKGTIMKVINHIKNPVPFWKLLGIQRMIRHHLNVKL